MIKIPPIYIVLYFSLGGWSFVWGLSPPKPPVTTGLRTHTQRLCLQGLHHAASMIAHTHTVSLSPRKATRTHSKSNFEKSVVVDSLVLKYGIIFQKANRNIFGQTTVKRPNISHNPKNVPPTILKYGQICKIWSQNCQSGNHGRWKGWKVGKPPLYFERKCFLKIFGSLAHYPKGKMPVFPPLRTPMLPRTKNAKLYTKISQIALKNA